MSVERVKNYLSQWQRGQSVRDLNASTATVKLAAQALNVEAGRIAKSLTFRGQVRPLMVVISGDTRIDNTKFKSFFNHPPKMLNRERALEVTGYSVGGICPFDLNSSLDIYLDISLKSFATVFPACGNPSSMIELTCQELEEYSHSSAWVDVPIYINS